MRINENFKKLPGNYLFSEVACRVEEFSAEHPWEKLIRLGIGDVTRPLPGVVVKAMGDAAAEMGTAEGFRGYGPEQGYAFLRQAVAQGDYASRGVDISPQEIFISDGAKSDCGSIGDLFGPGNVVAVCDPVYPAYVDGAAMAGRTGEYDRERDRWTELLYLPCLEENGFLPELPERRADLIWLCFPNNPTGAAAPREYLKRWVDYANENDSVILFDGAYEAFITGQDIPHSIYEIDGAKACAIEFRSFSKTAGFTGVRCGYTVVPKALKRNGVSLWELWRRRQAARFNGVSYVVQRGAQAVYTEEGQRQIQENLAYYRGNASVLREGLCRAGLTVYGGTDAPYLWVKTPEGMGSWAFFDLLLRRAGVVTTPGAGFGPEGEGYVRFTAFGDRKKTEEGAKRIRTLFEL